ncbi:MAG: VOC family protein [Desulfomonile tiedjei]|uniref:VOC family protein n=1 Tax=Desulfomonile tiedjei TaxID=2358 RepID=A0A9D6Z0D5_9BACT|nr:VOC family protein [Desulfomonile tiedjei]
MEKYKSAGINIPALHQVGIVVNDLEKTVRDYWNILGIGPWAILTLRDPDVYDTTYHGKPVPTEIKAAFAQVGECELELLETVKGATIYSDFIRAHGEGLHHVQYVVPSVGVIDAHAEAFGKLGFRSVGSGRFGNNGGWNYVDTTSALKTIWEQVKMADEFSGPASQYPEDESEVSPARIKVKGITLVGIVVKSLEETMQNYWDILGVGPWRVCEVHPPTLSGETYHGKPGDFTMRVSFANIGAMQVELLQPVSGSNIYSDFLAQHGEGLHHIQFLSDGINKTTETMGRSGFPLLMGGNFSNGAFAYYDTIKPLKCIWEAFQPPTNLPPMAKFPC